MEKENLPIPLWLRNKARHLSRVYLKKGLLKKPNFCAICGQKETKLLLHHADYYKPECVFWLCSKCHRSIHAMAQTIPVSEWPEWLFTYLHKPDQFIKRTAHE